MYFRGAAPAALTFLSVALSLQKVGHPWSMGCVKFFASTTSRRLGCVVCHLLLWSKFRKHMLPLGRSWLGKSWFWCRQRRLCLSRCCWVWPWLICPKLVFVWFLGRSCLHLWSLIQGRQTSSRVPLLGHQCWYHLSHFLLCRGFLSSWWKEGALLFCFLFWWSWSTVLVLLCCFAMSVVSSAHLGLFIVMPPILNPLSSSLRASLMICSL